MEDVKSKEESKTPLLPKGLIPQIIKLFVISVAAMWSCYMFYYNVFPRFAPNFATELTLDSDWLPEFETCIFSIEVEVTNKSIRDKQIDRVEFHGAWKEWPEKQNAEFELVDFRLEDKVKDTGMGKDMCNDERKGNLNSLRQPRATDRKEYKSPLIGEYAPEQSSYDGFQITSAIKSDKLLYIELVLCDEDNIERGYWYEWVEMCQRKAE